MARLDLYLSDDEHEFVKRQEAGYVRLLVQEKMEHPLKVPERAPDKWVRKLAKQPERK